MAGTHIQKPPVQTRGQKADVAQNRNSFLLAVRTKTYLSPSLRETAICRVAVLNRAWFEWEHHAPLLRAAEGITDAYVRAVFSTPPGMWGNLTPLAADEDEAISAREGILPDEAHGLVLEFTDALTLGPEVPPELFEQMRDHFGERSIVEISATIACYNCVSRFLVALDVGERVGESGLQAALEHVGGIDKDLKPAPRTYEE
jgi:alkylhydroperoxidase family enzyme